MSTPPPLMLLSAKIPPEIWAETILTMLDVVDLAALGIAYGPSQTLAAWREYENADAAAKAAEAIANAAQAAADKARQTARDLARKVQSIDAATPSLALSATLPARAAFQAQRFLHQEELHWFATHAVPVALFSECIIVKRVNDHGILLLPCRGAEQIPASVWVRNNIPHRENDLPAIQCANGDRIWMRSGKIHRDCDAAIERGNGDREWYVDGERHRVTGPAVEQANGVQLWYFRGKLHRDKGLPAVIDPVAGEEVYFKHGVFIKHGVMCRAKK